MGEERFKGHGGDERLMDQQSINWEHYLIPYEQALEELKTKFKNIKAEFHKRNEHSPIEFVTGRVKSVESICNKAKRWNLPIDENIGNALTDVTGIRIISQFLDDIDLMVDMIRSRRDMTVIQEKDYISHPKESGYRGYHLIVEYPLITAKGPKTIVAEIQIRTLAMNFWATIEHTLNYKYEGTIPNDIKQRLIEAARASFTLDREMNKIREAVRDIQ
ncbi:GTP pyrophosphokinase family protein [Bacillaceae bacterium]